MSPNDDVWDITSETLDHNCSIDEIFDKNDEDQTIADDVALTTENQKWQLIGIDNTSKLKSVFQKWLRTIGGSKLARQTHESVELWFLFNHTSVVLTYRMNEALVTTAHSYKSKGLLDLVDVVNIKHQSKGKSKNTNEQQLVVSVFPKVMQSTNTTMVDKFSDHYQKFIQLFNKFPLDFNTDTYKPSDLVIDIPDLINRYVLLIVTKMISKQEHADTSQTMTSSNYSRIIYNDSPDLIATFKLKKLFKNHLLIGSSAISSLKCFQAHMSKQTFQGTLVLGVWIDYANGVMMLVICVSCFSPCLPIAAIDILVDSEAAVLKLLLFLNVAAFKVF